MTQTADPPLLIGDIGGTKTNLALIAPGSGPQAPLAEATFASRDYSSLEDLVREFLARTGTCVLRAVFGVAGPVVDGQASITNLPWHMDETGLAETLGLASVRLLNDVLALARAVPFLTGADLYPLNKGRVTPGGTLAVVAPGTGLGEAYLTWHDVGYRAFASEGGHADFAPKNDLEIGLLRHLRERFDPVSCERVCSGMGIADIYDFLKENAHAPEPAWLAARLAEVQDRTPVIVTAALDRDRPCPLCEATLTLFSSILGSEAGNMALKVMAGGGVYIGGGIAPRILSVLAGGPFLKAFRRKGRMSGLMERIPVTVILNPKAALMGAALG
jgi:glucokinase